MSPEDFQRLYIGTFSRCPSYEGAYKAWLEYYRRTDAFDALGPTRGASLRHARQVHREVIQRIEQSIDHKTFRAAQMEALRDSEKEYPNGNTQPRHAHRPPRQRP